MKKILFALMIFTLCIFMIACDDILPGIGSDSGRGEVTEGTPIESMPPEPTVTALDTVREEDTTGTDVFTETAVTALDTEADCCFDIDWMDFVNVGGICYDGMFENQTIDESRVGDYLGEILYNVKSSYSSLEEIQAESKRDFTASFRQIGCEIFSVKDDENSIAVLDGGKYYIYTRTKS